MFRTIRTALLAAAIVAAAVSVAPTAHAQEPTPTAVECPITTGAAFCPPPTFSAPLTAVSQDQPAPCSASAPSADPVTIKGSGKTQTTPFALAAGAYTVTWRFDRSSDPSSYSLRLMPVVDAPFNHGQSIYSAIYTKDPDASGETHIYDVKDGRYYIAADAPKGWSVTFTPLPV